jgi:hypothetical protein
MRYYKYGQERGNVSVCGVLKVLTLKNGRTITADLAVVNLFLPRSEKHFRAGCI